MPDRAEEVARETALQAHRLICVCHEESCPRVASVAERFATVLRVYAEEARREEDGLYEIAKRISSDLQEGRLVLARDAQALAAAIRART